MTVTSFLLWVNCEIVETGVKWPQNISCIVGEADPENTTSICSYCFPPELTDPGTSLAAEKLWASLAGAYANEHTQEGKDKAGHTDRMTVCILACPALPPLTTPDVKYCSLYSMRAEETVLSYRWPNWGSKRLVVSGLNCLPALRVQQASLTCGG